MTVFSILAESRRRWWELGSSCGCTEVSAFPRGQGDGIHGTHWFVQFLSQLQNSGSCMCGGLGLYLYSAAGIQEPCQTFHTASREVSSSPENSAVKRTWGSGVPSCAFAGSRVSVPPSKCT